MADETKAVGRYSISDKLAIALACLSGVMAIVLFLVEKTPLTVIVLLGLMVALSIYPIFHFSQSNAVRVLLVVCVIAGTAILGWKVWPNHHVDAASQQQQPVQQTNQGNNNTNIDGNNNTVKNSVVINRNDPRAKAQLDRIEKLLKDQQDQLTPEKLLAKYPLGYVIFNVDYSQQVFPYRSEALQDWSFDWSTVKLIDHGDELELTIPTIMRRKRGQEIMAGNSIGFPKAVGPVDFNVMTYGNVALRAEVLAITNNGVIFLFGFSKNNHQPGFMGY